MLCPAAEALANAVEARQRRDCIISSGRAWLLLRAADLVSDKCDANIKPHLAVACVLHEILVKKQIVSAELFIDSMLLLHFSDTHDNRLAVDAVINIAARWKEAFVAITGDVCSQISNRASPRYDELPNPKTLLVRGNHDPYPTVQFSHLTKVEWNAPYVTELSSRVILIGLDSERNPGRTRCEEIHEQLNTVRIPGECIEKRVLIVLHHQGYGLVKDIIIDWAKYHFSGLVSLVLLHGHQHGPADFFAEHSQEICRNVIVTISNVYSANRKYCKGRALGCANLLIIRDSGSVVVEPVFDLRRTSILEPCKKLAK